MIALLPTVVGLYVGAKRLQDYTFVPWNPFMADLEVYLRAGDVWLAGGDIYTLPNSLPFIYPPFAAMLAIPLAILPQTLVEIGWVFCNILALMAILYRFGVRGWKLSLMTTAVVWWFEPVSETLGFGQLGVFMVALVFLDLVPGPRMIFARRMLPEGVLSGIATAIKLTPGLVLPYLVLVRQRRVALVMTATIAIATFAGFFLMPKESLAFWGRLAHGETGIGPGVIRYTNQSIVADWLRLNGLEASGALPLAAVVALLGVWAGILWHREGNIALAVCLIGVASLLASPISWSHHFVWIVPLAMVLLDRSLATPLRICGFLFVAWVAAAPYKRLPWGRNAELNWTPLQDLVGSMTALLGTLLIVLAIAFALRRRSARSRRSAQVIDTARQPSGIPIQ